MTKHPALTRGRLSPTPVTRIPVSRVQAVGRSVHSAKKDRTARLPIGRLRHTHPVKKDTTTPRVPPPPKVGRPTYPMKASDFTAAPSTSHDQVKIRGDLAKAKQVARKITHTSSENKASVKDKIAAAFGHVGPAQEKRNQSRAGARGPLQDFEDRVAAAFGIPLSDGHVWPGQKTNNKKTVLMDCDRPLKMDLPLLLKFLSRTGTCGVAVDRRKKLKAMPMKKKIEITAIPHPPTNSTAKASIGNGKKTGESPTKALLIIGGVCAAVVLVAVAVIVQRRRALCRSAQHPHHGHSG